MYHRAKLNKAQKTNHEQICQQAIDSVECDDAAEALAARMVGVAPRVKKSASTELRLEFRYFRDQARRGNSAGYGLELCLP